MITCVSVIGGWQSYAVLTDELFGPVFNAVTDLWAWQRANRSLVQQYRQENTMTNQDTILADANQKLMNVLERACAVGLDLSIKNGNFVLEYYDEYESWVFPPVLNWENIYRFENLKSKIENIEAEIAEQNRKNDLYSSAVAKLTAEELAVLKERLGGIK